MFSMETEKNMPKCMVQNDEDVRLSGHVTYVGRSSLEVVVVLDQKDRFSGAYEKVLEAVFLMVARDPMNTGPALVNPLAADSPEEIAFLEMGKGITLSLT
jgi:acyl-coenzyme A thioesterase 9